MARISLARDLGARYPDAPGSFGPPEPYPELTGSSGDLAADNRVYPLVRRALAGSGADAVRFGTPSWNPLGAFVRPGQRVFVLPNLVMHRRPWESAAQFRAQCTHGSVLRAVIDYALLATGPAGRVSFGSAPIQGSDYARSIAEAGYDQLGSHYRARGLPVDGPIDLRNEGFPGRDDTGCRVDLAADSLLEKHWQDPELPIYRVGIYDPDLTASFHAPGRHLYLVDRRLLEADVIISVPKLKMHSKVGLTCALKGAVGTVTHKGCLAHFREGAPEARGDEFPAATGPALMASRLNDIAAHTADGRLSRLVTMATRVGVRIARSMPSGVIGGNWPGNDTCWRMALDLSRILLHGDPAGTLHGSAVRKHLVLVDGVIAGEGDGPLHAVPREAGIVLFGDDPCAVDAAAGYVMGLDPASVPLLAESFAPRRYPLTSATLRELEFLLDGVPASADDLARLIVPTPRTARGWESCRYRGAA